MRLNPDSFFSRKAGSVFIRSRTTSAAPSSESEPSVWLADNLKIDAAITAKVWEYFRHGLTHEGRVKASAQFSFETGAAVVETEGIYVINPDHLLKGVQTAFQERCAGMDANRKQLVTNRLKRLFEREARVART